MTTKRVDKLLAEWFWTDRWSGSSGFLLPQEPRGLYREMLTQAWRRGARLPNDPAAIRRATGTSAEEWERCWPTVKRYWRDTGDGFIVNDTQVDVYAEAKAIHERAKARGSAGGRARAARAQAALKRSSGRTQGSLKVKPPSPSPSPSPSLTPNSIPHAPHAGEPASPVAVLPWNSKACELVIGRYGGTAPGARITKALRPLVKKHGDAAVLDAFGRYVDETDAEFFSPERFATTFGNWTGSKAPTARQRAGDDVIRASIEGGLKGDD